MPRARCTLLVICLSLVAACHGVDAPTAPTAAIAPEGPSLLVAPATVVVTTTADAGPGSLREALATAQDGDVIGFDPAIAGQSIVVASRLLVDKSVTIQGPQTSGITLSGGGVTGVLSVTAPAAVSLVNLTITDGFDDSGGAILSSGTLTIDHSALIGNEVDGLKAHGGAIYSTGPILSITNSTLSGNHARNGGAIMAEGDLTIRHTTITGNTAENGAGLWASGVFSVRNTIIAGNIHPDLPSAGDNCQPGLGVPILSGVNVSDDASCGPAGPSMLIANPNLAALAHNGGPTQTHALLAGSPAIDGAALCTLTDDQRYVARPQGGACDIGAYEFDTFVQIGLTVDDAIAIDAKTGVATLTGSLTCSAPSSIDLALTLTQVQKAGRLAPVVNATATATVACTGTTYWTAALTPATGAFRNGTATVDARTTNLPSWIAPAPATATVKLVKTKK